MGVLKDSPAPQSATEGALSRGRGRGCVAPPDDVSRAKRPHQQEPPWPSAGRLRAMNCAPTLRRFQSRGRTRARSTAATHKAMPQSLTPVHSRNTVVSVGGGAGGGSLEGGGGGGWHKASVFGCLPLAVPIGLSPPLILTLCGSERVVVVSTEPPDDLRGGYPPPPPHCTDSTPKTFPYPNTSPNRIPNRQKPPPPNRFHIPCDRSATAPRLPPWPPSPSSKALGGGVRQRDGDAAPAATAERSWWASKCSGVGPLLWRGPLRQTCPLGNNFCVALPF